MSQPVLDGHVSLTRGNRMHLERNSTLVHGPQRYILSQTACCMCDRRSTNGGSSAGHGIFRPSACDATTAAGGGAAAAPADGAATAGAVDGSGGRASSAVGSGLASATQADTSAAPCHGQWAGAFQTALLRPRRRAASADAVGALRVAGYGYGAPRRALYARCHGAVDPGRPPAAVFRPTPPPWGSHSSRCSSHVRHASFPFIATALSSPGPPFSSPPRTRPRGSPSVVFAVHAIVAAAPPFAAAPVPTAASLRRLVVIAAG